MRQQLFLILCLHFAAYLEANMIFSTNTPISLGQGSQSNIDVIVPPVWLNSSANQMLVVRVIQQPNTSSIQTTPACFLSQNNPLDPTSAKAFIVLVGSLGLSGPPPSDFVGIPVVLSVTSPVFGTATFNATVKHGAPAYLVYSTFNYPIKTGCMAATPCPLPFVLEVQDQFGNLAYTDSSHQVSVVFQAPSDASRFSFLGQTTVQTVGGIAAFTSFSFVGNAPRAYTIAFQSVPFLNYQSTAQIITVSEGNPWLATPITTKQNLQLTTCVASQAFLFPSDTPTSLGVIATDPASNMLEGSVLCDRNYQPPNGAWYCIFVVFAGLNTGQHYSYTVVSNNVVAVEFPSDAPDYKIALSLSFACNSSLVPPFNRCPSSNQQIYPFYLLPPGLLQCFGTDIMQQAADVADDKTPDCGISLADTQAYEACMLETVASPDCQASGYYNPIAPSNAWQNFWQIVNASDIEALQNALTTNNPSIAFINFVFEFSTNEAASQVLSWQWAAAQDKLMLQLDPSLIKFMSFGVIPSLSTTHTVHITAPFCQSVTQQMVESFVSTFFTTFLSNVNSQTPTASGSTSTSASSSGSQSTTTTTTSSSSSKITPYSALCWGPQITDPSMGFEPNVKCCNVVTMQCEPQSTYFTQTLQAVFFLPIVLGIAMGTYLVYIFLANFRDSYIAQREHEPLRFMSAQEVRARMKIRIGVILVTPSILVVMLAMAAITLKGRSVLVAGVMLTVPVLLFWFAVGFHRVYTIYIKGHRPTQLQDRLFSASLSIVLFMSAWMLSIALCWVTLGVMLAPDKILTAFAGVIVVIFTVYMQFNKAQAMMTSMQAKFRTNVLAKNGIKICEDPDKAQSLPGYVLMAVDQPDIDLILHHQAMSEEVAAAVSRLPVPEQSREKISLGLGRFARYRSAYILSALAATASVAILFVSFIIVAVSAFASPSGLQSTIGTAVIAFGGILGNLKSQISGGGNSNDQSSEQVKRTKEIEKEENTKEEGEELSELQRTTNRASTRTAALSEPLLGVDAL